MTDTVIPFIINGEDYRPEGTFEVVSPGSGKVLYKSGSATSADATRAVEAAEAALPAWRATIPERRRDLLLRTAEIMDQRREELAQILVEETGQTRDWAMKNVSVARGLIQEAASRISALEGSIPTTQNPAMSALVVREPFGVVLAMSPWNATYILGSRAIAAPLAAGNTVVWKGPEASPRAVWALSDAFRQAGVPAGALNSLVCAPADAPAAVRDLVGHGAVKKVNFTGSTAVGRIVGRLAGERLKPALLELGGKAPAVVWDDADLALAADQCALGAFLNAGQICMSTERVLVHRRVRAEFETRLAASIERFFPAGADAPVLVNEAGVAKNRELLRDAVAKGASLLVGDPDAAGSDGTRMRPVVVGNVTSEMDIYQTESFGPTVSLIEIETEEEALRIANDTEYGLTSSVFTRDLQRGLRLARGIETGAVHINSMTVHDEPALVHGGAKASGYGRFNAGALEEWTRTKTITFMNK